MHTVGIRELKAHLSAYLSRTQEGERFIVTDRGKEIAELRPLSPERRIVEKLAKQGIAVKWSGEKPKGSSLRGKIKGKPLSDTVLEDRR